MSLASDYLEHVVKCPSVFLPSPIEEERWEVALVEIATPSEVLNITEENIFFFLTFLDQRILSRI